MNKWQALITFHKYFIFKNRIISLGFQIDTILKNNYITTVLANNRHCNLTFVVYNFCTHNNIVEFRKKVWVENDYVLNLKILSIFVFSIVQV